MQAENETLNILKYVLDLGATGILALAVYAFMKGWIMSSKLVDKILEAQQKAADQTAKILADELGKEVALLKLGIEDAVARGTERGWRKANGFSGIGEKKDE